MSSFYVRLSASFLDMRISLRNGRQSRVTDFFLEGAKMEDSRRRVYVSWYFLRMARNVLLQASEIVKSHMLMSNVLSRCVNSRGLSLVSVTEMIYTYVVGLQFKA